MQITDVDLASAMGAGFGPAHPAIELLAEENDHVDAELKDDRLVLVIENSQEGYSLSPGTYELTYEIEEAEEKKYGVRGYRALKEGRINMFDLSRILAQIGTVALITYLVYFIMKKVIMKRTNWKCSQGDR